jgi:hypothetical protein
MCFKFQIAHFQVIKTDANDFIFNKFPKRFGGAVYRLPKGAKEQLR